MTVSEIVVNAPELSPERLATLTSKFVSIPSVNREHPELELVSAIATELETSGLNMALIGSADRPSLGVRGGADPMVLLNGHTDTVPVDDATKWRFDPFAAVIEDGFVHGRGACDMKGGLAIQVAVAQWLAARDMADGLVLHFAMGEERGEPGTEDLLAAGYKAPLGVVLEPTELRLGIAQRGLVTLRITISGRAGHASRPALTENPIDKLGPALQVIHRLNDEAESVHPLLGAPEWTATMVHSGVIPSMVPGDCVIHVDRRMIPGETVDVTVATLRSALAEVGGHVEIEVADEEGVYLPAEIEADSRLVTLMREAIESYGEEVQIFGTPYSSDIRHLINSAGIEAVTYGPGLARDMHARDEKIRVADLAIAARVVAEFCWKAMAGQ
jgi:succinyl-diaminopimelate desuccinylase